MSLADQKRWDEKWQAYFYSEMAVNRLLMAHKSLLLGGVALDLACGQGQNGIWLAQCGYQVLGVDISRVALLLGRRAAIQQGVAEQICWLQADLQEWQIPVQAFDVVCVFRFLDRLLFPQLEMALKPGGLLFYETRHVGLLQTLPASNPNYLLQRGELQTLFPHCQTLFYEEGAENAGILVRAMAARG